MFHIRFRYCSAPSGDLDSSREIVDRQREEGRVWGGWLPEPDLYRVSTSGWSYHWQGTYWLTLLEPQFYRVPTQGWSYHWQGAYWLTLLEPQFYRVPTQGWSYHWQGAYWLTLLEPQFYRVPTQGWSYHWQGAYWLTLLEPQFYRVPTRGWSYHWQGTYWLTLPGGSKLTVYEHRRLGYCCWKLTMRTWVWTPLLPQFLCLGHLIKRIILKQPWVVDSDPDSTKEKDGHQRGRFLISYYEIKVPHSIWIPPGGWLEPQIFSWSHG